MTDGRLRWLTAGESHGPALVVLLARRDRSLLKKSFPFGPFMVGGALVGLVWGTALAGRIWG